jgi:phage gp46-like protein
VSNGGLTQNLDIQTAVTISLFSDRLALVTDELPTINSKNRRGWWADGLLLADPTFAQIIGSRLWLLSRSKSVPNVLQLAQGYCYEALNWLLTNNIASAITVQTSFINNNNQIMQIEIGLYGPTFGPVQLRYTWAWTAIQNTFA